MNNEEKAPKTEAEITELEYWRGRALVAEVNIAREQLQQAQVNYQTAFKEYLAETNRLANEYDVLKLDNVGLEQRGDKFFFVTK